MNLVERRPLDAAPPVGAAAGDDHGMVIVRAELVHLRTLVRADIEHVRAWADDPFLERMVGSEFLRAFRYVYEQDGDAFYDACLDDSAQVVLVVEANGGEWKKPLGVVRLFNIHLHEGYAFLETMITEPRALRRGYGVEAGKLICAYAVDVLGLRRIEAKVYDYNRLSINSLKRHGFRQEGVLRQAGFNGGRHCDVLVFGLLREELEEQRKKENFYFPFDDSEGDVREPT